MLQHLTFSLTIIRLLVVLDVSICNQYLNILGIPDGTNRYVEPVITLIVRAYDRGIPSLSSEVPVQIFTTDVSARSMTFIVPQDHGTVVKNQNDIR